jgi:hypothetical protein
LSYILFDRIQEALDLDAFTVDATYDPQTGMPTRVFIGNSASVADDELTSEVMLIEPE